MLKKYTKEKLPQTQSTPSTIELISTGSGWGEKYRFQHQLIGFGSCWDDFGFDLTTNTLWFKNARLKRQLQRVYKSWKGYSRHSFQNLDWKMIPDQQQVRSQDNSSAFTKETKGTTNMLALYLHLSKMATDENERMRTHKHLPRN